MHTTSWRRSLSSTNEKTFPAVQTLISRRKCSKQIGKGANGKVLRVCDDQKCAHCVALKMPRIGSKGRLSGVTVREGNLTRDISKAASKEPKIFEHVVHHLNTFKLGDEAAAMEMNLITRPKYKNFQDLIHHGSKQVITKPLLKALLVQTFATLDWLNRHADGFIHYDLKPDQIAFRPWTFGKRNDALPTSDSRYQWSVPQVAPLWPVVTDFGLSYTLRHTDTIDYFDIYQGCNMMLLDSYRMLATIWESRNRPSFSLEARAFIVDLVKYLFGPKLFYVLYETLDFSDFKKKSNFGYLTPKGCRLLERSTKVAAYSDVIENPFFKDMIRR